MSTDEHPPTMKPPGLPASAPDSLRAFVECRSTRAEVEHGPVTWLPQPPVIGRFAGKPSLSFRPAADGAVRLTLAWLFVSLDLLLRVEDGQVAVDTNDVPRSSDCASRSRTGSTS
jgi:hypothetical protein